MRRIRGRGRSIALSSALAIAAVALPMSAGVSLFGASPAGAVACNPGIGVSLQGVQNNAPTTQALTEPTGDVLEYVVTVTVPAGACSFSAGTLTLTTPDGTSHTLATGIALANPGDSVTYATDNNAGDTPVISAFDYTLSAADIARNIGDPFAGAVQSGKIDAWVSVSGTSGSQSAGALADFHTQVLFQPTLATSEVTTSPQVAGTSFTDSATLSGLGSAGTAAGSVIFNLYTGTTSADCTGTPVQSVTETVSDGVVPNATFTAVAAGSYEIQAVYSGDTATFNQGATSACGSEPFAETPPTAPVLNVVKTQSPASGSTVALGSTVSYGLVLTNTGTAPATGITVTDALDKGITYVASSATCGGVSGCIVSEASGTVTWTGLTVQPGASNAVTVTFKATVNNSDTNGEVIPNFAVFTNVGTPNCSAATCDTNTVTVNVSIPVTAPSTTTTTTPPPVAPVSTKPATIAFTGADIGTMGGAGLALIVLGGLLVLIPKRRRPVPKHARAK